MLVTLKRFNLRVMPAAKVVGLLFTGLLARVFGFFSIRSHLFRPIDGTIILAIFFGNNRRGPTIGAARLFGVLRVGWTACTGRTGVIIRLIRHFDKFLNPFYDLDRLSTCGRILFNRETIYKANNQISRGLEEFPLNSQNGAPVQCCVPVPETLQLSITEDWG